MCCYSSPPVQSLLSGVPGGTSLTAPSIRGNAKQAYICMYGLFEIQQMCVCVRASACACVCVIMYSKAPCHCCFPSSPPASLWSMLSLSSSASSLFAKCRRPYHSSIIHSFKPVACSDFACN